METANWSHRRIADIKAGRRKIFDSWNRLERTEVDLDTLEMLDEDGQEIRIYDEAGYRIPRRIPGFSNQAKEAGVLVDLKKVGELFNMRLHNADDGGLGFEMDDVEEPKHINVYGYPQAFLHGIGHVQAQGLPDGLLDGIQRINKVVGCDLHPQDTSSDDESSDEDMQPKFQASPISGISCQLYNEAMHRIRPRASQHDAQLGTVTNAMAGTYARGFKEKRTAKKMRDICMKQLPHQHFEQRLQDDIKTGLRKEGVYKIVVGLMKPEYRNGRCVSLCFKNHDC
jgi:hypothetical protein